MAGNYQSLIDEVRGSILTALETLQCGKRTSMGWDGPTGVHYINVENADVKVEISIKKVLK